MVADGGEVRAGRGEVWGGRGVVGRKGGRGRVGREVGGGGQGLLLEGLGGVGAPDVAHFVPTSFHQCLKKENHIYVRRLLGKCTETVDLFPSSASSADNSYFARVRYTFLKGVVCII